MHLLSKGGTLFDHLLRVENRRVDRRKLVLGREQIQGLLDPLWSQPSKHIRDPHRYPLPGLGT